MAGLILLFHFCLTALELTKTYGLMYGSLYSLLILAAIAAYSLLLYATGRLISSKLKKNSCHQKDGRLCRTMGHFVYYPKLLL